MPLTLDQLVSEVDQLLTFPAVGLQMAKTLQDENSTPDDIAAVASGDPGLASSLLRMANSAALNTGRNIESISQAVTLLGRDKVSSLALAVSVASAFKGIPSNLVSVNDYWQHSLYCAAAARHIALRCKCNDAEAAFTAGLLHDIGHLVMFSYRPDESIALLEKSRKAYDGLLNFQHERELLGFDHAEVGAELARRWNLPSGVKDCIAHHHRPEQAGAVSDLVMTVHIANAVAVLAQKASDDLTEAPPVAAEAWSQLGLQWFDIIDLMDQTQKDGEELLSVFAH